MDNHSHIYLIVNTDIMLQVVTCSYILTFYEYNIYSVVDTHTGFTHSID